MKTRSHTLLALMLIAAAQVLGGAAEAQEMEEADAAAADAAGGDAVQEFMDDPSWREGAAASQADDGAWPQADGVTVTESPGQVHLAAEEWEREQAIQEANRIADQQLRPFYMDFGLRLARAPDETILQEVAVDMRQQLTRRLELGVGMTGGSAPLISGSRSAFSMSASVGVRGGTPRLHGYIHVGMAGQRRGGARLPAGHSLAALGLVGARVNTALCILHVKGRRPRGCMTVGAEVRLLHALTGGWLMDPAVLPDGASILSTAITLGMEI